MTDAAPAAAPVAVPTPNAAPTAPAGAPSAPNGGANTGPSGGAPAARPQGQAQNAAERRRIALHEMPDDDVFAGVVDGKEQTWTAAEVRRRMQTEDASTRRFQEAKRVAQEAAAREQRLARTLSDPRALAAEFRKAGLSPADFAKAMLDHEIAEASMTPEQRKLREYEEMERGWREQQERARQTQTQREVQSHARAYETAFNEAAKLANVPDSPRVRRVVTEALVGAVRSAIESDRALDQSALVRIARQAYEEHAQDYRRDLPEDDIIGRLTPEIVAKWQAAKGPRSPISPTAGTPRDANGRFAPSGQEPQSERLHRDNRGRLRHRDAFSALMEADKAMNQRR